MSASGEMIPLWNPHARFVCGVKDAFIETVNARYDLHFRSKLWPAVIRFACDGTRSLRQIADDTSISLASLITLFKSLGEDAIVDIAPALTECDLDGFFSEYYRLCDAWSLDIFKTSFWETFLAGKAPIASVFGWGLEFFHRTQGADDHNALAVAYAADEAIRSWLRRHTAEEFCHGELFIRGLTKVGYDADWVRQSKPIATTSALIQYMSTLAVIDSIAYLACYGILHAPHQGQDAKTATEQFDHFGALYPPAMPVFAAIRKHALLDFEMGHDRLFLEQVLRDRGSCGLVHRLKVLRAAHGMAKTFADFFAGIDAIYGGPNISNRLPHDLVSITS